MAQSLVKLTLESNQYERNLRNAQRQLQDFTRGIGINMKSLSGMALAVGSVTTALKVAKDAFFKNEQQLDDWNRVVEQAKSTYNGFLNALNNGDISGFLSNIDQITEAAKAAYNAMDALSTFNAFNQINTEKTRTGLTESIASYRTGGASKEQVKAAAEAYKKELQQRQEMEKEAYTQAVRKIAAERGVPWGNLEQALTGSYGSYQKLKEVMPTGERMVSRGGGMFTSTSYIEKFPVTAEEKMGAALRALNDTELKSLQALGAQAERTGNEIAQVDKQLARVLNGKIGGSGSGSGGRKSISGEITYASGSIAEQEKLVSDLTKKWREAGAAVRDEYKSQLEEAKYELEIMRGNVTPSAKMEKVSGVGPFSVNPFETHKDDILEVITPLQQLEDEIQRLTELQQTFGGRSSETYQLIGQRIYELKKKHDEFTGKNSIEKLGEEADSSAKAFGKAAGAISSIGSAMQSIEDPTAKILGMIAEAIASIALGFSQAIGKDIGKSGNVWYGIAAAAAGVASMITTISAIHSATGYAQGGVIEGTHYSGDMQYARVNAGETILTRAQAGNIASQLEGGGLQNLRLSATISGEQIRLVLNNNGRRTGRGEYVTTNFQRG